MSKNYFLVLGILLLFVSSASAVRVAIVVDYPASDTYTACVPAYSGMDGYAVLEDAGLSIDWTYYASLGHGLCGIEGVGCPSSNCFCSASDYWGFYLRDGDSWTYSDVGFDGGSSCGEHYCASDGDVIGLAWGPYGTEPEEYSFSDVCCDAPGDVSPCGEIVLSEVVDYITAWSEGKAALGNVVDLIGLWADQPVKG